MRSEFDFIQNIKNKYDLNKIGDDCAVLPKDQFTDMVVTSDLLVEGIDFRLDWSGSDVLGHKALAVSLSDVAAMGAEPKWSILSIGVPEAIWNSSFLDDFYSGYNNLAARFNVELVGGDISRTLDKVVIDSVVGGEVSRGKAILRSTAKVGDLICVTGCLGGAAGGLSLLNAGTGYLPDNAGPEFELMNRQLRPSPRLDALRHLRPINGVSAMIDISDGMSSDLAHICTASGVGARIDARMVPVDPSLSILGLDGAKLLDLALNGGEDFELLFTLAEKKLSSVLPSLFSVIGEITASVDIIELVSEGMSEILAPGGYRHF